MERRNKDEAASVWLWQRRGQAIAEPCTMLIRLMEQRIAFPPGKYRGHQPEMMDAGS